MRQLLVLLIGWTACQVCFGDSGTVGPVPDSLRQARKLDAFYQKHLTVNGFSILGSARVSDEAIQEAAWVLQHMLAGRDDILQALDQQGVHLTVMAWNEFTTDVPEHRHLEPRVYWDRRARGLGGSPVSCGEENLLCYPGDPYGNDALHNHVNTRSELKEYDPALAQLCSEVLGDQTWRYRKPTDRPAEDCAHLARLRRSDLPQFRWREESIPDVPRVLIQTELGDIELDLDARRAPQTVKNFLAYVHDGYYGDGSFFRTVTSQNQPDDRVKIEVIQAQAGSSQEKPLREPIPLERTCDTGLHHTDGVVSMARTGPDTAQDHFFICVGPQPELDFAGQRNPDGQGFAAFGRVVKGMDVVHKIHAAPADGQQLTPPVRIQRAVRLN
ncbi:MAG: peptidylprolyl isomerase [Pirellulaceae bacterium]